MLEVRARSSSSPSSGRSAATAGAVVGPDGTLSFPAALSSGPDLGDVLSAVLNAGLTYSTPSDAMNALIVSLSPAQLAELGAAAGPSSSLAAALQSVSLGGATISDIVREGRLLLNGGGQSRMPLSLLDALTRQAARLDAASHTQQPGTLQSGTLRRAA